MTVVLLRLIDSDESSLSRRVNMALASLPEGCIVSRFTYWYTSRPPVHEALVLDPSAHGTAPVAESAQAA